MNEIIAIGHHHIRDGLDRLGTLAASCTSRNTVVSPLSLLDLVQRVRATRRLTFLVAAAAIRWFVGVEDGSLAHLRVLYLSALA